jgi:methylaspartate ammonia-lyase
MVETPIICTTREEQIRSYKDLVDTLKSKSIDVKIIIDEWCNTLDDVDAFSSARAADIIQIKPPDMGGIPNSIESALLCKKRGLGTYIGGTVNGTDQSAKITTHIALATQADLLLGKPGQGVDEALMIELNEMKRTLTLINQRRKGK